MLEDAETPEAEWEAPVEGSPGAERKQRMGRVLPGRDADIHELRRFLRDRFPTAEARPAGCIATGLAAIDDPLGGGLPLQGVSELMCSAPSAGGQVIVLQLLRQLREQRRYAALVDGCDSFDPRSTPPPLLEHLLWLRCNNARQALKATDVLLRDENFPLVLLDLRWNERAQFRGIPATTWYRLQRLCAHTGTGLVVFSARPTVPSARIKIELSHSLPISAIDEPAQASIHHIEATVQKSNGSRKEAIG